MKVMPDAIGINVGSGYARCACAGNKNAVPVMIPNRWGKTATPSEGRDVIHVLRALREDAEVFLERFVSSCAIAVPEYFSPLQRDDMVKSAEAAGMNSVSVVSEPIAAALAFGGEGRFLILDIGAGVSCMSVVENEGGAEKIWKILESRRSPEVCGCNFDLALAEWLRERLGLGPMSGSDPRMRALLLEAETIKIALSSSLVYDWQPPPLDGGGTHQKFPSVRVEREELERMTRFSIKRLLNVTGRLWEKYRPERFLTVGGSSRIPILQEMLERGITRSERMVFGPEEAAASGAAIYAAAGRGWSGQAGKIPASGRRMKDLKIRLAAIEPLLTAAQKKRLHVMADKLENFEDEAEALEILEGIAKGLEKDLFPPKDAASSA